MSADISGRYRALGYQGGGRLYDGDDLEAAKAAAVAWAEGQDAGAAVFDTTTGVKVFVQIGEEVQVG